MKPNTEYDLEYYLKTERLESAETPVVVIVNATDESWLAGSPAAPSGSNNWQRISLSFKTGAKTEAVKVKMPNFDLDCLIVADGARPVAHVLHTAIYRLRHLAA